MHNRPSRHIVRRSAPLAASALLAAVLQLTGALAQPQEPGRSNPNRHREYPDTPLARRLRAVDPHAFEFAVAHKPLLEQVRATRRAIARGAMSIASAEAAGRATAVADSFRYPVIVGRFAPPNDWAGHDPAELAERLFAPGHTGDDHTGSLRDYYEAVSFGRVIMQGDVFGYAQVDSAADYYRDNNGDSVDDHLLEWIDQVVAAVDDSVDFSRYDVNPKDGFVDVLILVHNLKGYECTSINPVAKGYWSHRWAYHWASAALRGTYAYLETDDEDGFGGHVKIRDYVMQPMQNCATREGTSGLIDVGVFAHEMGHAFGLPDYYDIDGADSGGESEGLGEWALMASGNWNRTFSPAAMCAVSRYELGWYEDLIELDATDAVGLHLPDVYRTGTLVRLHSNAMEPDEYFLAENRQAYGFDAWLHSPGLLIYHINDGVTTVNTNPLDLRWALEQADGLFHLEANVNRGDAGDPWPGVTGNTHFWAGGVPASTTRSGEDSNVEVVLQSPSADTMAVDIFTTPSFALNAPTVGALLAETRPQLAWDAYSPSAGWGGVRYEVELDTSRTFATAARDTASGTGLVWASALTEGVLWHWRVSAFDDTGHRRVNSGGPGSFTVDATAPDLTLGILRNPVLSDHLDLILVGSEPLSGSSMTVDDTLLDLVGIARTGASIMRADIVLTPGQHLIRAAGTDAAGNAASVEATLSVALATAGRPFALVSADGRFTSRAGAGAVYRNAPFALLESDDRYTLIVPERVPGRTLEIVMDWTSRSIPAGRTPVIWRERQGVWEALETAVDLSAGTATALVESEGTFELRFEDSTFPPRPAQTDLEPPWPNPFNPSTRLAFSLRSGSEVRLTIVDVRGRTVCVLADGYRAAGRHLVRWDGTDAHGRRVASGIYLAVLETRTTRLTRKLTLLR